MNSSDKRKVKDHCYYKSLYQGESYSKCNLAYRILDDITIAFHNLSSFHGHLFIKELGKKFNKYDIGVTAGNKEKYISFTVEISLKLEEVSNKEGKEVYKNIQPRFTKSC